jgi:hypothetical protein
MMTPYITPKPSWTFAPVWECIYCGAKGAGITLGKEHIIPFSLGGTWVLPRASCASCSAKTLEAERYCAHDLFGNFRVKLNLPTRHPKQRPSQLPYYVQFGNRMVRLVAPPSEHPTAIFFPLFDSPGILDFRAPDTRGPRDAFYWILAGDSETALVWRMRRLGGNVVAHYRYDHFKFGRMLAKIAHSFAIALFGLNAFQPFLRDFILGKSNHMTYFIGSTDPEPALASPENLGYQIGWKVWQSTATNQLPPYNLLIIEIRLFPSVGLPHLGPPRYFVVVGQPLRTLEDGHQIWVKENLLDTAPIELPLPIGHPVPWRRVSRIKMLHLPEQDGS